MRTLLKKWRATYWLFNWFNCNIQWVRSTLFKLVFLWKICVVQFSFSPCAALHRSGLLGTCFNPFSSSLSFCPFSFLSSLSLSLFLPSLCCWQPLATAEVKSRKTLMKPFHHTSTVIKNPKTNVPDRSLNRCHQMTNELCNKIAHNYHSRENADNDGWKLKRN